MFILSDTCFWNHLKMLSSSKNILIDGNTIFSKFRWGITPQIREEFLNYNLDMFLPLSDFFIVPLSQHEIDEFVRIHPTLKTLDKPDLSLLVAGIRDKSPIVSDDGGLMMNCLAFNLNAMYIPDFLLQTVKNEILTKKELFQCLKFWEAKGAYKKKFIKKWKRELQKIS